MGLENLSRIAIHLLAGEQREKLYHRCVRTLVEYMTAWMDSEEKALADGGVSQAVSVRERPLTYDTQISMSGV